MIQNNTTSRSLELSSNVPAAACLRERTMLRWQNQFLNTLPAAQSRFGLSRDEARFAFTDALLALEANLAANRFRETASLATYFRRIFYNKCVDHLRRSGPRMTGFPGEQVPDPTANAMARLIRQEETDQLDAWCARLSPRAQELLRLYRQDCSMQEIAERMGLKNAQVARNLKLKTVKALRRIAGLAIS